MAEVAAVIGNPFPHGAFPHGAFGWAGRKALGRRLAITDFQRADVLPNSWQSARVSFLAKIPERVISTLAVLNP